MMFAVAAQSRVDDEVPLPGFAPELRFVVAAARLASGGAAGPTLDRAGAQVRNWDIVHRGLAHHGLVGLAVPGLLRTRAVPAAMATLLTSEHGAHVVGVMHRMRELVRIGRALDAAGIRHLFIKGIALSV